MNVLTFCIISFHLNLQMSARFIVTDPHIIHSNILATSYFVNTTMRRPSESDPNSVPKNAMEKLINDPDTAERLKKMVKRVDNFIFFTEIICGIIVVIYYSALYKFMRAFFLK